MINEIYGQKRVATEMEYHFKSIRNKLLKGKREYLKEYWFLRIKVSGRDCKYSLLE
jgi:hypothetical protein